MKMFPKTVSLLFVLPLAAVHAQRQREPDVPLMRAEERRVIDRQAQEFADAIQPVARQASQSTLGVWEEDSRRNEPIAFATVVGDGTRALTKWSEIALIQQKIYVHGGNGMTAWAKVIGVYQDEDLALLELEGASFRPVEWAVDVDLTPGRFLVAAKPDDSPAAVGVISVAPRSLREKDRAFLGVEIDNRASQDRGVRLEVVQDGSAAHAAGLRHGDVILAFDEQEVSSATEVHSALLSYSPGDRVKIRYLRHGQEAETEVELREKPEFPSFRNDRLRVMENMGGRVNLVRTGFPSALQTDLKIKANQCGGPVVDLDGKVVGISIARGDRTHALLIPSAEVVSLLEVEPVSPDLAEVRRADRREGPQVAAQGPAPRQAPRAVPLERGSAERLRRHLEDMERLMEIMRREMESIGE